MNQRDTAILDSLKRFRVLDRDQLIMMHFQTNKDPIQSCNKVLKRLVRDGIAEVDKAARPFNYFPSPSTVRKNSTKIPHYKAIVDFYLSVFAYKEPTKFEVEFKTGKKGSIEPDIYMTWNKAPFFVEIQRNVYTKKVMEAKMNRYKDYYTEGSWKEISKHFPFIWLITDHTYTLDFQPLRVYQTKDVHEFVEKYMKRSPSN